MLAGIVINNSILFLNFIIIFLLQYPFFKDTILVACETRFYPILRTTLIIIFGMLFHVLNIGGGGDALRYLAIAIIGGLSYEFLLVSMLFIPVMYALLYKNK